MLGVMKKCLWVAATFLFGSVLLAAPTAPPAPAPEASADRTTPGVEAARAVSTLTGVAISPLLGVGAVGAWKYYRTPLERRAGLPWFARPWFWSPALLIVLMVFIKDAFGPAMPTVLKKPFDLAELFENKLSAVLAAGAFVPIVASIFHSAGEGGQLSAWGLAAIDLAPLGNLLVLPLALAAFVVVFLAGHAINVLILISPFATVDAALKSGRLLLVSSVAATSLANPYVGAAWALAIVLVSYFIAGWSLRMSVFGTVFAWDLVTFGQKRCRPAPGRCWAFTARKMEKAPVRTFGRLARDEQGGLVLHYRPWLILPRRTLALPAGERFVGRGLFFPEVRRLTGAESEAELTLPPRYRSHEEKLAELHQLGPVRDIGLRRGVKAVWGWLKSCCGLGSKAPSASAPLAA
jgi:hypothetical protein